MEGGGRPSSAHLLLLSVSGLRACRQVLDPECIYIYTLSSLSLSFLSLSLSLALSLSLSHRQVLDTEGAGELSFADLCRELKKLVAAAPLPLCLPPSLSPSARERGGQGEREGERERSVVSLSLSLSLSLSAKALSLSERAEELPGAGFVRACAPRRREENGRREREKVRACVRVCVWRVRA